MSQGNGKLFRYFWREDMTNKRVFCRNWLFCTIIFYESQNKWGVQKQSKLSGSSLKCTMKTVAHQSYPLAGLDCFVLNVICEFIHQKIHNEWYMFVFRLLWTFWSNFRWNFHVHMAFNSTKKPNIHTIGFYVGKWKNIELKQTNYTRLKILVFLKLFARSTAAEPKSPFRSYKRTIRKVDLVCTFFSWRGYKAICNGVAWRGRVDSGVRYRLYGMYSDWMLPSNVPYFIIQQYKMHIRGYLKYLYYTLHTNTVAGFSNVMRK